MEAWQMRSHKVRKSERDLMNRKEGSEEEAESKQKFFFLCTGHTKQLKCGKADSPEVG